MSAVQTRTFMVDFLRREVLGPDPSWPAVQLNGEEIIRESPKSRYGAGILFPQKSGQLEQVIGKQEKDSDDAPESDEDQTSDALLQDDDKFGEAQDQVEQEVPLTNEYSPSAMGLSALIRVPEELVVNIRTAQYFRGPLTTFYRARKDKEGKLILPRPPKLEKGWYRKPLSPVPVRLTRSEIQQNEDSFFWKDLYVDDEKLPLKLHIVTRKVLGGSPDLRLITLTLVNQNVCKENSPPDDEDCFFQTEFEVSGSQSEPCFEPYPDYTLDEDDEESKSLFLLYRHRIVFGVGHGCAVNWTETGTGAATQISTDVVPAYEIKPVRPAKKDLDLSMKMFAHQADSVVVQNCRNLSVIYRKWISDQRVAVDADSSLTNTLRKTAKNHLDECEKCCQRIEHGVALLEKEPVAMAAFKLMNEAMLMQQAHYKLSTKIRPWILDKSTDKTILEADFEKPDYTKSTAAWYPFQLGFILMNLRSIFDPQSAEREIVDLIWFPTGGGKTEAYLGLTAFVIFLRRLRGDFSSSTAVLMRYTLRLLTTQQFQRAASLICACEVLRKRDKKLGTNPFSIGLWVGGGVTPNKKADAIAALNELSKTGRENKFVITSCPWCGCQMGPISVKGKAVKGYIAGKGRVVIWCEDKKCPFSVDELPVCVVDEQLYETPPTVLVGTVDKFAMLPWDPRAGVLFGQRGQTQSLPPELIIQDELHLISGPLGSMVGLYEPLIDLLSSRDNVRPKIVASTATISRADEQIQALYGRKSALFPPQALVAGESFFAHEDIEAVGRLYVGIFGSAYSSHATSQVRTMSALLQAPKMSGGLAEHIDPYWTLMGYFNSIRELGHAVSLVQGDIAERILVICERHGISRKYSDDVPATPLPIRKIQHEEELTSRVNSTDLPAKLAQLFCKYDGNPKTPAIDVCFATNMIQVGLDVSRLSLMAVVGQPKTTSEYIQASSRVGRESDKPGLVVVNYNPAKPRDRSHYERFRQYHQSIYRNVEPTSVTPFALPVRDRALHALIIALVRLWGNSGNMASPLEPLAPQLIKRITDAILKRVAAAEPDEVVGTDDMIASIFDKWMTLTAGKYGGFGVMDPEPVPLMYPPGSKVHLAWEQRSYETPNNMRSVDKDCEAAIISGIYPAPTKGN